VSEPIPWEEVFRDGDGADAPARVILEQITARTFVLGSSMRFEPPFELGAEVPEAALTLTPDDLKEKGKDGAPLPGARATTDLASVPGPFRWFLSTYGVHTPAVLLHDRLIGSTALQGVSDTQADRLFRLMLEALGVPFLRRWLMWAAVAFGTRWRAGGLQRALIAIWAILALGGMGTFVWALVDGQWIVAAIAAVAPIPAAALWGAQFGAGLVAAYSAVWLAPPTILGVIGYGVYWAIEWVIARVIHTRRRAPLQGRDPVPYREF
jgi:hypothetical protein